MDAHDEMIAALRGDEPLIAQSSAGEAGANLTDVFDTSPSWYEMSIREKLRQQVEIRGTSSPFGAMAKDALAEILRLETLLEIANGEPHH